MVLTKFALSVNHGTRLFSKLNSGVRLPLATGILLAGLCLGSQPAYGQVLTAERQQEIAETVGQLFNEIPQATNALDFDRLLGYYQNSEVLTYVVGGRVTRTYEAFANMIDAQFSGVAQANLRWLDTHVDVLSREVVVATATYEFTTTLASGGIGQSAGTYTCIYVLRDGRWQIQYSAHTFPLGQG